MNQNNIKHIRNCHDGSVIVFFYSIFVNKTGI